MGGRAMRRGRGRNLQPATAGSLNQFIERAGADRQAKDAAHRSAQRLPAARMRRAVARHHAGRTERVGRSDRAADGSWILNAAEAEHERFSALQCIVNGYRPPFRECDDTRRCLDRTGGFEHTAGAFVNHRARRLRARRECRQPAIRQQQFETNGGVECFSHQVFAVEQHHVGLRASGNAAAALNDGVLTAGDTRRGGHEHDDSMLASRLT